MKENDKKLKNLKDEVPLRAPVTQQGGDFIRALGKIKVLHVFIPR